MNKSIYLTKLKPIFGYLLVFSIFFPILTIQAILKPIKLPFLAIGLLLSFTLIVHRRNLGFHRITLGIAILYIIRGIYGTISGYLQSAPGVFAILDLSLTYIIVYFLLTSLITKVESFYWVVQVLYLGTLFVVILDLCYILIFLEIIPYIAIFDIYQLSTTPFTIGINQYKTIELYARNLGVLAFSFPFFLSLLYEKKYLKNIKFVNKYSVLLLVLLTTILMLICGRRIFWLIILVSPVFLFLFTRFLTKEPKRIINKNFTLLLAFGLGLISMIFTYTAARFDIKFEDVQRSFTAAFDNQTESVRSDQHTFLLNSWKNAPFFGKGIGAAVDGYYRNRERPWAFELGFHVSLHRLGLFGFGIELLYYFGILFFGIKIIRRDSDFIMIGLLCGMMGFLLAHATNPFLNSYEFLWPIILPLAYINVKLLNK